MNTYSRRPSGAVKDAPDDLQELEDIMSIQKYQGNAGGQSQDTEPRYNPPNEDSTLEQLGQMPQLIPVQMYQVPKLILRRKLRNQVNLARDWNHQTSQRLYLQNTQLDDHLEVLIEYPVKLSL